jgi:glycosyltransferase involved in cell wall biosynthesis
MRIGVVSILIPNFNKGKYLEKTLSSILNQEYKYWECIIVDDGSTDSSRKILDSFQEKDARFKIFDRPSTIKKGSNFCRNFAYSLASGEYIQWFDSDDLMYPWFIKAKVDLLKANPNTSFVVAKGDLKFEKKFKGNRKFGQNFYSKDIIPDYLKFRILFFTAGPLFRKHVFTEVGLFNEKLYRHQEWELYLRVLLRFRNFKIVERSCFTYFVVSQSITSSYQNRQLILRSELELFLQVLSKTANPFWQYIPQKDRIRIAFRCFLLATYNMQLHFSLKYFKKLIVALSWPKKALRGISLDTQPKFIEEIKL